MIAKLRGRVNSVSADGAVIDVGGVGYQVFCSARTLSSLPAVGEAAELAVETHVREDHIHLYGFATVAERETFRTLTTVQGVGAKVGLSILSALSVEQIGQAIAANDASAFKRATGVGPKLAARLAIELKDKIPALGMALQPSVAPLRKRDGSAPANVMEDAVSALVNLGYGRMEAFGAVSRVAAAQGNAVPIGALLKAALRELGGSDG